jgi:hypothetical protein
LSVFVPDADSFPPGIASKLKTYVYRLSDRVFAHIHDED